MLATMISSSSPLTQRTSSSSKDVSASPVPRHAKLKSNPRSAKAGRGIQAQAPANDVPAAAAASQASASPLRPKSKAKAIDIPVQASSASSPAVKPSTGKRRGNAARHTSDAEADVSAFHLSRSAPSGDRAQSEMWDMPKTQTDGGMTWQQQLLNAGASSPAKKDKGGRRKPGQAAAGQQRTQSKGEASQAVSANTKAATGSQKSKDTSKEALTWQQALLNSSHHSGPRFDTISNARDAATFGDANKSGRQRADSLGTDSAARRVGTASSHGQAVSMNATPAPIHMQDFLRAGRPGGPSTPTKKAAAGAPSAIPGGPTAYAGPIFHNSPEPASLPMPKFTSRAAKAHAGDLSVGSQGGAAEASGSGSSSGSDDDSNGLGRNRRSTTAPAASGARAQQQQQQQQQPPPAAVDRPATIEALLAKMMVSAQTHAS